MKFFILILLLFSSLYARAMIIDDTLKSQSAFQHLEILETSEQDVEKIKGLKFSPLSAPNIGYQQNKFFWTKLVIANHSDNPKRLIFVNPKAGMDIVDMYVYQDNLRVQSHKMGDNQPFYNRPLQSRLSGVVVTLEAQENLEIYTKLANKGPIVADMVVYDAIFFIRGEMHELIWLCFIFTLIALVMLYSLFLVVVLWQKAFILYGLHVSTMFLFYAATNGLIFYSSSGALDAFQDFMEMYGLLIGVTSILIFDLVFFHIKSVSKITYNCAVVFIGLSVAFKLAMIFQEDSAILYALTPFAPLSSLLVYLYTIFFLIFLVRKKLLYAKYYFMGHLLYMTGLVIFVEYRLGVFPENSFTKNIGMIGIILEAGIIAIAMSVILRHNILEKQKAENLLLAHFRFLSIGRQFAAIVHQWRIPLNRISSITMYLESLLSRSNPDIKSIRESIPKLNETITFMDETITSFQDFYCTKNDLGQFNVYKEVDKIIEMLRPILDSNRIIVFNECDTTLELYSRVHIFKHVILILSQNAVDALSQSQNEQREFYIFAFLKNDKVSLKICDNAGGIEQKKLVTIFDGQMQRGKGVGIGLQLAHFLVNEQLKGKIQAYNDKNGAVFELSIPSLDSTLTVN